MGINFNFAKKFAAEQIIKQAIQKRILLRY